MFESHIGQLRQLFNNSVSNWNLYSKAVILPPLTPRGDFSLPEPCAGDNLKKIFQIDFCVRTIHSPKSKDFTTHNAFHLHKASPIHLCAFNNTFISTQCFIAQEMICISTDRQIIYNILIYLFAKDLNFKILVV